MNLTCTQLTCVFNFFYKYVNSSVRKWIFEFNWEYDITFSIEFDGYNSQRLSPLLHSIWSFVVPIFYKLAIALNNDVLLLPLGVVMGDEKHEEEDNGEGEYVWKGLDLKF